MQRVAGPEASWEKVMSRNGIAPSAAERNGARKLSRAASTQDHLKPEIGQNEKRGIYLTIYASGIGTSVHNDSPANPHEIKVFWQQENTFH